VQIILKISTAILLVAAWGAPIFAQETAPPTGGRGRGPTELWLANKTPGGVYKPPMRPLWKLADLKRMHAGQNNWTEQIILDPEQDAIYNSGAPGITGTARMHPDTPAVFVVVAGQIHFIVEGQEPVTATRGAIINIMKSTVFSYEVTGDQNALWVEVNPTNYKTVYPANGPAPTPSKDGTIVKLSFHHIPAPYTPPNRLMFNTFDDAIAKCIKGEAVLDDHLFASPLLGYLNPAENKCGNGTGNIGGGPGKPGDPPFDPHSVFGHMHPGPAEWWIVQVGQISGKFENMGEFHAVEGDVLYAAPMSWHQMAAEAPSGPNVRLAMGAYPLINMNNTERSSGRGQ
jgi:mannose-6-phosphate isomerase-like protein (cupin superfamily)